DLELGAADLGAVEVPRGRDAQAARELAADALLLGVGRRRGVLLLVGREEDEAALGARRLDRALDDGGDDAVRVALLDEAARDLEEGVERPAVAPALALLSRPRLGAAAGVEHARGRRAELLGEERVADDAGALGELERAGGVARTPRGG